MVGGTTVSVSRAYWIYSLFLLEMYAHNWILLLRTIQTSFSHVNLIQDFLLLIKDSSCGRLSCFLLLFYSHYSTIVEQIS